MICAMYAVLNSYFVNESSHKAELHPSYSQLPAAFPHILIVTFSGMYEMDIGTH